MLAVSESGRYLEFVGLKTSVDQSGSNEDYLSDTIIAIYDTFQQLIEQLIGEATMLLISFSEEGLRLSTDTTIKIDTKNAPLPIEIEQQDDTLLIIVKAVPVQKHHKCVTTATQTKPSEQLKRKGGE